MSIKTPFASESTLFRPVDQAQHSDDWPIFNLANVEVFSSESAHETPSDLVSLLTAGVLKPLTVRGKIPLAPKIPAALRLRKLNGIELLEILEVQQFAYGQYEDGEVEIWAAGKSGWFSIKPSRIYKEIYDEMSQAIQLLYFCTDAHVISGTKSRKNKTRKDVTAEELLARWAALEGLPSEEDAAAVFRRHRHFLMSSMVAGKEDIEWQTTNLFAWYGELFPDLLRTLEEDQRKANKILTQVKTGTKRKRASETPSFISARVKEEERSATPTGRKANSATPGAATPVGSSGPEGGASGRGAGKRHKGKSILRPRTSKYVIPPKTEEEMDQSSMMTAEMSPTPTVVYAGRRDRAGRAASRNHPTDLAQPMDVDTPNSAVFDEGIDMSLDNAEQEEMEETELIVRLNSGAKQVRRSTKILPQHTKPKQPGDVWSCPLDGCMHKIFSASTAESQRLIKEHYRLHVDDEDAEIRMELVRKMEAPGMRVGRLMTKIQKVASQRGMPPQILRRY